MTLTESEKATLEKLMAWYEQISEYALEEDEYLSFYSLCANRILLRHRLANTFSVEKMLRQNPDFVEFIDSRDDINDESVLNYISARSKDRYQKVIDKLHEMPKDNETR